MKKILFLTGINISFLDRKYESQEEYVNEIEYYKGFAKGLKKSGYDVLYECSSSFFLGKKFAFRNPALYKKIIKLFKLPVVKQIDRFFLLRKFSLIIKKENVAATFHFINNNMTGRFIQNLNARGVKTIEWFGVYPNMVKRSKLETLKYFSNVLCPGEYFTLFEECGIDTSHFRYIPSSFNEEDLYNDQDEEYAYDVCFIGGITKGHLDRIELLEAVAEKVENFAFYGYGAQYLSPDSVLRNKHKGWASNEITRKLYSSSKIAINIPLDNYEVVKRGINQKAFQIPACKGAAQLIYKTKNIWEFFDEEDLGLFNNKDELLSKITTLLEDESFRTDMVEKAYSKNIVNSYGYRANRLIEIIES